MRDFDLLESDRAKEEEEGWSRRLDVLEARRRSSLVMMVDGCSCRCVIYEYEHCQRSN